MDGDDERASQRKMEAVVMKRVMLVLGVAAVCGVLLAGRDDVRRFREMRKL
jgi:hypothetical protein